MSNYVISTTQRLKETPWQEAKAKRQALLRAIRRRRAAAWDARKARLKKPR